MVFLYFIGKYICNDRSGNQEKIPFLILNFRCRKLAGVAGGTVEKIPNKNPLAQIEEERREHQTKMTKMEREMEEVFERKVREKRQKLADSQADLEKRHRESKEKLEAQKRELEAKMSAFEQEKVRVLKCRSSYFSRAFKL